MKKIISKIKTLLKKENKKKKDIKKEIIEILFSGWPWLLFWFSLIIISITWIIFIFNFILELLKAF